MLRTWLGSSCREGWVNLPPPLILLLERGQPRRYLLHWRDSPACSLANTTGSIITQWRGKNDACSALVKGSKQKILTAHLRAAWDRVNKIMQNSSRQDSWPGDIMLPAHSLTHYQGVMCHVNQTYNIYNWDRLYKRYRKQSLSFKYLYVSVKSFKTINDSFLKK